MASGRAAERAGTRLADPVPKPLRETSCPYPFTSQWDLRELYRNPWGAVRVGRLLEDLDSLAGNVAFSHCDDGDPDTFPPVLATVAVDRCDGKGVHLTGAALCGP